MVRAACVRRCSDTTFCAPWPALRCTEGVPPFVRHRQRRGGNGRAGESCRSARDATALRPVHISGELAERGARPNGTTSFDRTNYFETVPAADANLRWALDLDADRMVHSFVAAKDLASEMTVVRNEFEFGENDPGSILRERIMSTAFLWHNSGDAAPGHTAAEGTSRICRRIAR